MNVRAILESLLRICNGSEDYFVSGSLSFLPLAGSYRAPGHDVDVAMSDILFRRRLAAIRREGTAQVLRLGQVAMTDRLSWGFLSPKTAFVHVHTPAGLLDLARYRRCPSSLTFSLGLGFSACLPSIVLDRIRLLEWEGLTYRAAPLELGFLPKAMAHSQFLNAANQGDVDAKKHLIDLERLAPLVDWDFAESLWNTALSWRHHTVPVSVAKALLKLPDFGHLKAALSRKRDVTTWPHEPGRASPF